MTAVWPASTVGARALDEVDGGHFRGALRRRDAGLGRLVGRVGRRDDGTDVDDERQRFVLADDVAAGLGPVGEVGRDVELHPLARLDADEPRLPARR